MTEDWDTGVDGFSLGKHEVTASSARGSEEEHRSMAMALRLRLKLF